MAVDHRAKRNRHAAIHNVHCVVGLLSGFPLDINGEAAMKLLVFPLLATTALIIPGTVYAQAETADEGSVPEIIVTAQKRNQNLQDVGLAISALGSEQLRNLGVKSAEEVSGSVAGVQVYSYIGSQPTFVVRGIGVQDFSPNIAPTAAVYLDEVYLGSNIISGFQVFDTERVEVLKGPQGDLFGRNTTGGAISYTTKRPTSSFEGYAEAGYGNYETVSLDAALSGPIASGFNVRVAGRYSNQNKGYYRNTWTSADTSLPLSPLFFNPKRRPGDGNEWALRGLFEIELDGATLLFNVHGGERHADVTPFTPIGFTSIAGASQPCAATALSGTSDPRFCGDAFGYSDLDGDPYTVKVDFVGRFVQSNYGASLRGEFDLGTVTLTSITSYDDGRKDNFIDTDGAPHHELNQQRDTKLEQYSQEFRLVSASDGPFQWIAGAYGAYEKIDLRFLGTLQPLLGFTNFTDPVLGSRGATGLELNFSQKTKSIAGYAHAEWAFTDRLTLVLGARYTHEKKDFTSISEWLYSDGLSPTRAVVNFGSSPADAASIDSSVSFSAFSGKAGLNFKPSDDLLLYANLSRGFKSGGYDGDFAFTKAQLAPFKEETLTSVELGWKAAFANRRFRLNGAIFHYSFKNPQVRVAQADPVTNLPFNQLINLAKARVWGGEIEANWRPIGGLDLSAGLAFNDSKVRDTAQPVFDGNTLPLATKFSATWSARYQFPLDDSFDLAVQADGKYNGSFYLNPENTSYLNQPSYVLLNARVSLLSDAGWELSAWAKNLTKEHYAVQSFALFGAYSVAYSPPRTYGLSARFAW